MVKLQMQAFRRVALSMVGGGGESGRIEWVEGQLSQLKKAFNRGVESGLAGRLMMYVRTSTGCL
jgi:hypothetical protein